MEFRVLGNVAATAGGRRVDLGSRKQRLVLAILLLEPGRAVALNRIIDLLWSDDPPASARNTVQALVSRLRAAFRPFGGPEIVADGTGYLLRADPMAIDAFRFTALIARAAVADDEHAVELLDEALALWRGEALADVAPEDVAHRLCGHLVEARWTALEDRLDAQLRLGWARRVLAELTGLVAANPLRQRLVGQLMQALHRQGRTDEALQSYRDLRTRLADELGLDPGTELAALHRSILAEDAGAGTADEPVRPAQLPHDVGGFVGRDTQLAALGDGAPTAGLTFWVISGTAGVGKTALAVHWAHRVRAAFPDGQLYLDLRGFDADHEPLTAASAVTQLLRALGTEPRKIPPGLAERAGLLRSLLADKRVLLVLDNVRDAGQVNQLLPPSGTVLVTSRLRLAELVARTGGRALALPVLAPEESRRLLEAVLGNAPVAAESAGAAELAHHCGHLPLALRVAAANLGTGETGIAELARHLAEGDPLLELAVDGAEESAVSAAFAMSYRALPDDRRLLFRRLALLPGQTFTAQTAAALVGVAPATARQRLKSLAAAHLIELHTPGRYRMHDLLRRYAAARADAEDQCGQRESALRAVFTHYLEVADAAGRVLIPHFLRLPRDTPQTSFVDTGEALSWLDAEWPNLAAAVDRAAATGPVEYTWHLVDALRAYFHHRGHHTDWIEAATTALDAARAAGHRQAQAAMHMSIALACVNSGRYETAREHLVSALRGNLAEGWAEGQAAVLNNLSTVHQRLGDPKEAIRCGREALRINEARGESAEVAMPLANLGFAHWQLGELAEALDHFGRALRAAERDNARFSVAVLLGDLANVHRDLGHPDQAEAFYAKALTANRDLGYAYGEAAALTGRALLACRPEIAEVSEQAHADALQAVELTRRIGDRGTQAYALTALGQVCLRLGRVAEAADQQRLALAIATETSFFWCQASARAGLAEALLQLGNCDAALAEAELARDLAAVSGYRLIGERAERVLAEAVSQHRR